MSTGIDELDEEVAFWKTQPEAIEQAVITAFFRGMALGTKMVHEKTLLIRQRAAPGTKNGRDVDQSPDFTVRDR
jgi:hypothetical protein